MKIKIAILIVMIALFSFAGIAQTQKGDAASAAVNSFYKFHRSQSDIFNARGVALRKKWFSKDLYDLFLNELKREKAYLKKNPTDKPHFGDGFPFQPYDECFKNNKSYPNRYEVGESSASGDKTIVEVRFYNPKQCDGSLVETYKVELVNVKGQWLISDWIYPDGTTLTQDLKRQDY